MRFPYPLRKFQGEILELMEKALEGGHLILQAGTGSGKTVCSLHATLQASKEQDRAVLYLVRTNSQQRQVMVELRRLGAYGVALQGRQRMCLLASGDRELTQGSPEELSQFCRDRKEEVIRGESGCTYYSGLLGEDLGEITSWCRQHTPSAEETKEHCQELELCPYELNKLLAPQAGVVTAPYIYFFSPPLRRALLEMMQRSVEDLLVVVDEAHNLPDYCRDLGTFQISVGGLERALDEVMDFGDPEVGDGISAFDLLESMRDGVVELSTEYVLEEDNFLPPSAMEATLMHSLTRTTSQIKASLNTLATYGEFIRETRRQRGRLPRSYVLSAASNLLRWMAMEEREFAKLVVGGEAPALKAYCLDPSLVARPLLECGGILHMSGTLQPLEEYRDSLGLPQDALLKSFPSPFPKANRRAIYLDGVTTRYEEISRDPKTLERLRGEVSRLLRECKRNTLFLFPSYALLETFLDLRRVARVPLFVERRGMQQSELMETLEAFKASTSILFAVAGGRVAEGIDFPDRELEVAVIVGIPYPKPTAALQALVNFYDWKFGKGWEYAILAPTSRKIQQAVGRLIRSERDRGVAVILDRRAVYFKRALGPMERVEDPLPVLEAHLSTLETSAA